MSMTMMRISICAGALVMAATASAAAAPAYVPSTVNLRSGPGTNNEIVGKIPGGALVDASNCAEGWCEVTWQDKKGFAIQTGLDLSGRVPPRAPARVAGPPRPAGVVGPDDEYVPIAPGPGVVYGPPVVYGPGVVYGGPYYRPYYGWRGGYRGYRRW